VTKNIRLAVAAVAVIVLVGVVLSQFASSEPDGLEFIAEREGFADNADEHTLADTPLADYGESGVSRAIAAGVGIVVTLGVGLVVFKTIGHKTTTPESES